MTVVADETGRFYLSFNSLVLFKFTDRYRALETRTINQSSFYKKEEDRNGSFTTKTMVPSFRLPRLENCEIPLADRAILTLFMEAECRIQGKEGNSSLLYLSQDIWLEMGTKS
ncbi:hypothetical protein EVAR_74177_1 [Eumeta japonica]|uniref:Uncharacterized protein n=1 Tax=Eumeta variegata TaxID=151549 RepID=A0A4C1T2M8_EUMVA|nr:hypothetical protein EVAR_74177_1 [Eumeta japonica]